MKYALTRSHDAVFDREWNRRDGYRQWYRKPHVVGPHQTRTGQRANDGGAAAKLKPHTFPIP